MLWITATKNFSKDFIRGQYKIARKELGYNPKDAYDYAIFALCCRGKEILNKKKKVLGR